MCEEWHVRKEWAEGASDAVQQSYKHFASVFVTLAPQIVKFRSLDEQLSPYDLLNQAPGITTHVCTKHMLYLQYNIQCPKFVGLG